MPLQHRPFPILEQILDDAGRLRGRELSLEHSADGFPSIDRRFRDPMIYGVRAVGGGKRRDISVIERTYPGFDNCFGATRGHGIILSLVGYLRGTSTFAKRMLVRSYPRCS